MRLTNTKKIAGGMLLMLALVLSAITGFAQEGPAGHGPRGEGGHGGIGFFARQLNLSDAQKEQMKQIAASYQQTIKNLHEQLRNLHQNEFDPLSGAAFNEAAVRSQAQARANLEVEMEVTHAHMMSDMYAVLTSEQKAQLAQLRQQWAQKRQQERANRNANSGQNQ